MKTERLNEDTIAASLDEWLGWTAAARVDAVVAHYLAQPPRPEATRGERESLEREKRIVSQLIAGWRQRDVATLEGLSQARISQIWRAALIKLADIASLYEGFYWYDDEQARLIYHAPKRVWAHQEAPASSWRERMGPPATRFLLFENIPADFWEHGH